MSNQLQITGEAKIRTIQGPVVANSGVITALDGDASEYVRGDGTLADFPTSTGGGSSVSYYLNTSISQGTIGGVAYKQLSKVPIAGAGTDVSISANGYIASYLTDANDPALLEVPAGNFNCEFYFSVNSDAHNPYVYAEVYKYDGTTFTLLGSNVSIPQYLSNGTTLSPYYFAIAVSTAVLTVTDRIAIKIYVNVDGRTVTLHTENNHLCQVVTTFSKGIISLNNLTRQNQFFGTGTSGTDFAISSSVATHTFNLPVASAANTGKLSSTDWSTFNSKQDVISLTTTGSSGSSTFSSNTLNVPTYTLSGLGGQPLATNLTSLSGLTYVSTAFVKMTASGTFALDTTAYGTGSVTSVAALTLGTSGTDLSSTVATSTTTPVITLNVPTASATNRGALSSADWTTFNNKANALSGTINTIAYWDSSTTIASLALATYPSLTELSYVKGVTSAIQTQLGAKLSLSGGTLTGQLNSNSNINGANFFISLPTAQPATSASVGISANTTSGYLDITGYIYGLRIIQSATGAYGPIITTFENNGNITTTGGNTLEGVTNIKPNANFTITQNSVVPFTSVSSGAIVNSLYLTGRKAGFGTATPRTSASGSSNTLDVKGGIYFGNSAAESCTINNDDSMIFNIDADNTGTASFFRWATNTTQETGGTELMKLTEAGILTINALGSGSVTATSGVLSAVSDMNLKIDDGFINNALGKVLNLKPRYFHWKEESGLPTDLRQLGFYAQEVNEALGEEVANTPSENGNWGIYDRGIIAMLTKAIQEQQAQIEELSNRLIKLESK